MLCVCKYTFLTKVILQVRRLSGFESMATATTICSDKTGTLTLNQVDFLAVAGFSLMLFRRELPYGGRV